jgi:hypothetical protein
MLGSTGGRVMKRDKLLMWAAAAAAMAALPGCGKNFPIGEKLLPASYGPPFGPEVERNLPKHPHYPAGEERHALVDSSAAKTYRDHQACHAALRLAVEGHGKGPRVMEISPIESLGLYEAGGAVHEYRCNDYKLTHRSWCASAEGGHGEAHKKSGASKAPEVACKGSEAEH